MFAQVYKVFGREWVHKFEVWRSAAGEGQHGFSRQTMKHRGILESDLNSRSEIEELHEQRLRLQEWSWVD